MSNIFSSDNRILLLYFGMLVIFLYSIRNLYRYRSHWSISDLVTPIVYYPFIFLILYFVILAFGCEENTGSENTRSTEETGLFMLAFSVLWEIFSLSRSLEKEHS